MSQSEQDARSIAVFHQRKAELPFKLCTATAEVSVNGKLYVPTVHVMKPYSSLELSPFSGFIPTEVRDRLLILQAEWGEDLKNRGSVAGHLMKLEEYDNRTILEYWISALPNHHLLLGGMIENGYDPNVIKDIEANGVAFPIGNIPTRANLRTNYNLRIFDYDRMKNGPNLHAAHNGIGLYTDQYRKGNEEVPVRLKGRLEDVAKAIDVVAVPLVKDQLREAIEKYPVVEDKFNFHFQSFSGDFVRGGSM